MARYTKNAVNAGDELQEEMTVVILRLKGGSDTLKKGFDALNAAFTSIGAAPQLLKRASTTYSKQLNGNTPPDQEDESDDPEDESDIVEATSPSTTSSRGTPAPRPKPKFLSDFDLTVGDVSWKDFASTCAPKSDDEKYLVAALWITEKAGILEFSIPQIFTCFRAMKWNEPADFSQPIRRMKLRQSYFSKPNKKVWKLTQPGLDAAHAVKTVSTS